MILNAIRVQDSSRLEQVSFTTLDWSSHFGIEVNLTEIPPVPWADQVLESPCPFIRNKTIIQTHFLFLALPTIGTVPLTISKWRKLLGSKQQPKFLPSLDKDPWFKDEDFVHCTVPNVKWFLLFKGIVPQSEGDTYVNQTAMLPPSYNSPSHCECVALHLLYYLKTGMYLNRGVYIRSDTLTSRHGHVCIGCFDSYGLSIHNDLQAHYWGPYAGIGASRKENE